MRVYPFDFLLAILFGILAGLYISTLGFQIVLLALGVGLGVLFGGGMGLKTVRSVERKGEDRPSWKTITVILVAVATSGTYIQFLGSATNSPARSRRVSVSTNRCCVGSERDSLSMVGSQTF